MFSKNHLSHVSGFCIAGHILIFSKAYMYIGEVYIGKVYSGKVYSGKV